MTFNFTPKTDEELAQMDLLPIGNYDFVVKNATDKVSKSGNPMIELQLQIPGKEGGETIVYDYLVSIDSMAWKIKHFCQSIGLMHQYQQGGLNPAGLINTKGKVSIIIENRDNYPPKNKVKDYIVFTEMNSIPPTSTSSSDNQAFSKDDLPF